MATIVSGAHGASGAARWSADQEALLVDGLRAGRRDAFEQLYEQYRVRIYNLTLRIVQSPEDACDITQDVFIKAFRKLPESPVSGPHLTPWLYRVAVNASYDHLRTRKQHGDIDDLNGDSPAMPIDPFEQAEMGRRVEQTLTGLSERHRTVLILKDIHGLRHDEIAEILDVSRGATETLLFRAREAFRTRYLELTQSQSGSRNIEKWSAAGIGVGMFLREAPLPAALHGAFPSCAAAGAGGAAAAGAAASAGGAAGGGAAGASVAGTFASGASAGATAAGAAAGGAGTAGSSAGLSLAAGGLLAKVGGAAAVKLAAVVVAATCAAGGGVAAYETAVLPGVHHKPSIPPAQAQAHKDEKAAGKTAGAAGRNDSASLTGAARSTAARERAAEKKAAKARGKAAGKADRAARPGKAHGRSGEQGSSSGNGAGAGAGPANAEKGGSSNSGGSADAGNQGGNAGGQSARPDTPDRPDKPGKND